MGRKYNLLQMAETDIELSEADKQALHARGMLNEENGELEADQDALKEAEKKRQKDTDIFYEKYYKPETSHLAVSARKVDDKWTCLSNMFKSREKIMNSWFMKFFHISPENANTDELNTCLRKLRSGNEMRDKNDNAIVPDPRVREMLITYTKVKHHERALEEEKGKDPKTAYSLAGDATITPEQRKGLEKFQLWLQRNCDKTGLKGIKYGLGKKGPVRNFAEEFMKLPARVQLKALFLLESGKRKSPNEYSDNVESQTYVPNLDKLKDTMIASKFKIFRRLNGSQFYWNKLEEAVGIARQSGNTLKGLSNYLVANRDNIPEAERPNRIQEFLNESGADALDVHREIEHTGEKWDDTKAISGYVGKAKSYYSLADNINKLVHWDEDAKLIPNASPTTAVVGAATSLFGLAGSLEGTIKSYGTSTKAGFTSKVTGTAAAAAGVGNATVGITKLFYDGATKTMLNTTSSLIGAGTGAIIMAKSAMDYLREDANVDQAVNVKLDVKALQKLVKEEYNEAVQNINNSDKEQEEKDRELQAEHERYRTNIDNLKLMHKAAKHSINDGQRQKSSALRGLASGFTLSGSSAGVIALAGTSIAGLAAPIALTAGTVIGVGLAVESARHEDKQKIQQNREYIDEEMYEGDADKDAKLEDAEKAFKKTQKMWEDGSDEAKKCAAMAKEAENKSEVFQDQVRDLYAAQKGYTHQSSAKENIKGDLFGRVYDAAFRAPMEQERESEKRIRLGMQELLRSQDLHVHHNEGKQPEKQKEQPTREKAVATITKR